MPAYTFEALDAQGQTRKGVMEAETVKAARSQLRAQTLVPLKVEPVLDGAADAAGANAKGGFFAPRVFNSTKLAIWTRQIAGLISSGLPLERALTALTDEAEDEKQRNLIASLRAEVNAGSSFARALGQHPREFSEIYIAVVGAGEHSGQLGLVLERLADELEEQQALRAKLLGAALYPGHRERGGVRHRGIPAGLCGAPGRQCVCRLQTGPAACSPSSCWASAAVVRNQGWAIILVAMALIAVCARFAWASERFRIQFDAWLLGTPLVGRLMRGYNAARFSSTLAMLTAAGVPILKALQAAAETLSNRALREDALAALVLVREGAPLASALAHKQRFPALIAMFARLGEQTGQLPQMLDRAANQLRADVQRRAMQLATLLEPLLIVGMGLVVMLIVLAVLLPIIQLNQLVK
jgi:general secretion pathway protein F